MTKREKCAEAGREVRRIQREYLREVAGEVKEALEGMITEFEMSAENREGMAVLSTARKALEKARRLGL